MSKILNSIAAFSMLSWIVGFFFYNYGPEVHLLLAAAVGLLIIKVLLEKQ
ncbi:DUF5670 family protein [Ulvibacterium marinum]